MSVPARVILHLKRTPERYKIIEPLADILDIKEETRTATITALWHYIKVNGLQDKVDRKIIRPDAKLKPVCSVYFSSLSFFMPYAIRSLVWTKLRFSNFPIL